MVARRPDANRYCWNFEVTSVQVRSHWIDVFSKYLFAAPLANVSADTGAREHTKFFFTRFYIPKNIIADLGKTSSRN